MEILQAMRLLNLEKLETGEEQKVKKAWRDAMKQSHPDIGGSQDSAAKLNEAYTVLLEKLRELKENRDEQRRNRVRTYIIKVEQLKEFTAGETVRVNEIDSGESIQTEISKSDIQKNNIYVEIDAAVNYNGRTEILKNTVPYSLTNKYEIGATVRCGSIGDKIDIRVSIGRDSRIIQMLSHKATVVMKLSCGTNVTVHIERRVDCG